jgi:hypothetical protein
VCEWFVLAVSFYRFVAVPRCCGSNCVYALLSGVCTGDRREVKDVRMALCGVAV